MPMTPPTSRKIAFIGSHSIRKTNAVHSFAGAVGRSGRSVEELREQAERLERDVTEKVGPA